MDNKAYSREDNVTYKSDDSNTNANIFSKGVSSKKQKLYLLVFAISILILLISIVILAIGIAKTTDSAKDNKQGKVTNPSSSENICTYSDEAKERKLPQFFLKVQKKYFEIFPEKLVYHPKVTDEMIKQRFQIHDVRPENIRKITNEAQKLLKEAIDINPDFSRLKSREHKAYLQIKHFLQNTFGYSYMNYTAGLWLMGPTGFCSEPICSIGYSIYNGLAIRKPSTKNDIDFMIKHFNSVKNTMENYIMILKDGIQRGMVRTQVECTAGINAFKQRYRQVSLQGAKGLKEEWYSKKFYEDGYFVNVQHLNSQAEYNFNVSEYVISSLENTVGESIAKVIKYLQIHLSYCRPDDLGFGGLSALPLDYIYYQGKKLDNKTNYNLPGNIMLNGTNSYLAVLGFFTTKDIHPTEVHDLGWKRLHELRAEVMELVSQITGDRNQSTSVEKFKNILSTQNTSYFNDKMIPANESNQLAFDKCISEETAKLYCPNRWNAMMKWFSFAREIMSLHDEKTVDFFYFTGKQKTTPSCPVKLAMDFNPTSAAQSYTSSRNCNGPSTYKIPFFLTNLGPVYTEYSINAHEARPGHHTQVQGLLELFGDACGGPEQFVQQFTFYTAFTEGWALYAENPLIAQGTDVYKNNLMQKYGMLKWQIWRALRLVIDTGLHYVGMSRQEALNLVKEYAWDESDLAEKEVTRYQSNIGQATGYMIGQLDIWRLRNVTEQALGKNFDLKEFHYQILSQGSSPLAFLESHINKYIDCKKDTSKENCNLILDPPKPKEKSHQNLGKLSPERVHYI